MINVKTTTRLLSMPIIWMGVVQFFFSLLSLFLFHDHVSLEFFVPATLLIFTGSLLFYVFKNVDLSKSSYRDALIFASFSWVVLGILGGFPILSVTGVNFSDSVFESISALTTTGATVLSNLDDMPLTFLMYRQFLQWMGGLGIVIFVVAVLPMLNVGGMKLLKAETPGPIKDDKVSPRIANTARYLWGVYIGLTVLCAIAYYYGGMSLYDAVAHSFTTISTGGFSTHDESMWFYKSHLLLVISNIFMMLGAISFALHFRAFHTRSHKVYMQDEETKVFVYIVCFMSLVLGIYLFSTNTYNNVLHSLSFSTFHVISFITSTGFGAATLSDWPAACELFLVIAGYIGGCAGSTAGGNKIIRNIIAVKAIDKSMKQMLHPHGVFHIKFQNKRVSLEVQNAIMAFFSFVMVSTAILTITLMTTGLSFWASFTAVAACLNVLGPGFAEVGSNFQPVSDFGIWVLSGTMILGRLEYFTVFALFCPRLWST